MSLTEGSWNTMMGLSKIFLRRFIIGCFLLCILTIASLTTLVVKMYNERIQDEKERRLEIIQVERRCHEEHEAKNRETNKIVTEGLRRLSTVESELAAEKQKHLKK